MILESIGREWKKTHQCDLGIAKEKFSLVLASGFLLPKNSPYKEYFSRE